MHAITTWLSRVERNQANMVIFSVGNGRFGQSMLLGTAELPGSNLAEAWMFHRLRALGFRH